MVGLFRTSCWFIWSEKQDLDKRIQLNFEFSFVNFLLDIGRCGSNIKLPNVALHYTIILKTCWTRSVLNTKVAEHLRPDGWVAFSR